ncbi:hypothetical protein CCACVL1_30814 [Corchorus capsularis]|uniref:Uncharacterized protein n=1 Tax=Corchorus capsularis TaxID=210143 RepID=A0A1R3FVA2_COCAP|nr:hypothetical protein CCACVL1_30814 [Corchorus capsularis]
MDSCRRNMDASASLQSMLKLKAPLKLCSM